MVNQECKPQYPREIILEVTNFCNLRCRHCHFHGAGVHSKRRLGFMKREIWERVLDEISSWDIPVTLMTHGAGEPLLYPDLLELLREAKKIPNINLGFMTNAMLLNKEWASNLVALQVDWIAFSVDGVIPKTHDFFRVGANLKVIEENVRRLVAEKKLKSSERPYIRFNMVGYPEILDQSEDYVRKWLPCASSITISKFRPIGSKMLWDGNAPFPFRPCPLLYRQMTIAFDGSVGLCCEDIHLDVPVGSVRESSMEEIFNNSPVLLSYRRAHERGKIDDLMLCQGCHVWGGDIRLESSELVLSGMPVRKTRTPAFELFERM